MRRPPRGFPPRAIPSFEAEGGAPALLGAFLWKIRSFPLEDQKFPQATSDGQWVNHTPAACNVGGPASLRSELRSNNLGE